MYAFLFLYWCFTVEVHATLASATFPSPVGSSSNLIFTEHDFEHIDLTFNYLTEHYLLYANTNPCRSVVEEAWSKVSISNKTARILRPYATDSAFALTLVGDIETLYDEIHAEKVCSIFAIEKGMHKYSIAHVIRPNMYFLDLAHFKETDLVNWLSSKQQVTLSISIHAFDEEPVFLHYTYKGKERYLSQQTAGLNIDISMDMGSRLICLSKPEALHENFTFPVSQVEEVRSGLEEKYCNKDEHEVVFAVNYMPDLDPRNDNVTLKEEGEDMVPTYIFVKGNLLLHDVINYSTVRHLGYYKYDDSLGYKKYIPTIRARKSANHDRHFNEDMEGEDLYNRPERLHFYQNTNEEMVKEMEIMVNQSRIVSRTFSEKGFELRRLPTDLWAHMQAYWNNNKHHRVQEYFSNGTVSAITSNVAYVPMTLTSYWHRRLLKKMHEWVNSQIHTSNLPVEQRSAGDYYIQPLKLEPSMLYGMREYVAGSKLVFHIDRLKTHAASIIVNIEQTNVNEPWPLQIFDHAGNLHEVIMTPGDILYYESAKCIHGRVRPLRSGNFVNIFAHYRPIEGDYEMENTIEGDDHWYEKQNPQGTIAPVVTSQTAPDPRKNAINNEIFLDNNASAPEAATELCRFWYSVAEDITSPIWSS